MGLFAGHCLFDTTHVSLVLFLSEANLVFGLSQRPSGLLGLESLGDQIFLELGVLGDKPLRLFFEERDLLFKLMRKFSFQLLDFGAGDDPRLLSLPEIGAQLLDCLLQFLLTGFELVDPPTLEGQLGLEPLLDRVGGGRFPVLLGLSETGLRILTDCRAPGLGLLDARGLVAHSRRFVRLRHAYLTDLLVFLPQLFQHIILGVSYQLQPAFEVHAPEAPNTTKSTERSRTTKLPGEGRLHASELSLNYMEPRRDSIWEPSCREADSLPKGEDSRVAFLNEGWIVTFGKCCLKNRISS